MKLNQQIKVYSISERNLQGQLDTIAAEKDGLQEQLDNISLAK